MLQNDYLVAIVAVHTAENEPFNVFHFSSDLILTERSHPRGARLHVARDHPGAPALRAYTAVPLPGEGRGPPAGGRGGAPARHRASAGLGQS